LRGCAFPVSLIQNGRYNQPLLWGTNNFSFDIAEATGDRTCPQCAHLCPPPYVQAEPPPNLMGFRFQDSFICSPIFGKVLEVVWPRKLARIETSGSADDVQKGVALGDRTCPQCTHHCPHRHRQRQTTTQS
jgi:hypothetical protein